MKHIDFRDQIASNKRKSFFLMFFVIVLTIGFGFVISFAFSPEYFFFIMIIAIIFSLGYTWYSFYNSHKLAIMASRAKKADRIIYKDYYRLVEGLTIASGLPMPELYIMDSENINAFASGRDPKHAVICVTKGALKKLERRELEGVLAHELGHIANYDIRFITLITVMVGMISILSQIFLRSLWFKSGDRGDGKLQLIFMVIGIVLAIIAPLIVMSIQAAVSRKREYVADATAVKFTRNPLGLIGALKKIGEENKPERKISKAVASMFFSNPFLKIGRTHPPLNERIKVLENM